MFVIIPRHINHDARLSNTGKSIYAVIRGYSTSNGYTTNNNMVIAEKAGCCVSLVQSWLQKLEEYGYIKRETWSDDGRNKRKITVLR